MMQAHRVDLPAQNQVPHFWCILWGPEGCTAAQPPAPPPPPPPPPPWARALANIWCLCDCRSRIAFRLGLGSARQGGCWRRALANHLHDVNTEALCRLTLHVEPCTLARPGPHQQPVHPCPYLCPMLQRGHAHCFGVRAASARAAVHLSCLDLEIYYELCLLPDKIQHLHMDRKPLS